MTPQRIQLRRMKGWRLPAGAVVVARPTRWGNPHRVHPGCDGSCGQSCEDDAMSATEAYRFGILAPDSGPPVLPTPDDIRRELAGKDLACWCDLADPCHVDVLLKVANADRADW